MIYLGIHSITLKTRNIPIFEDQLVNVLFKRGQFNEVKFWLFFYIVIGVQISYNNNVTQSSSKMKIIYSPKKKIFSAKTYCACQLLQVTTDLVSKQTAILKEKKINKLIFCLFFQSLLKLFVCLFSCLFMFVTRLFFLASLDNMLTTPNKEMFFSLVKYFFFVKSFICFFRHYPQFLSLAGLQNHLPSSCWRLLQAPFCSSGTLTQLRWSHPKH